MIGMALFRDHSILKVVRHLDLVLPGRRTPRGQRQRDRAAAGSVASRGPLADLASDLLVVDLLPTR
jgi:hypothetical protein